MARSQNVPERAPMTPTESEQASPQACPLTMLSCRYMPCVYTMAISRQDVTSTTQNHNAFGVLAVGVFEPIAGSVYLHSHSQTPSISELVGVAKLSRPTGWLLVLQEQRGLAWLPT